MRSTMRVWESGTPCLWSSTVPIKSPEQRSPLVSFLGVTDAVNVAFLRGALFAR